MTITERLRKRMVQYIVEERSNIKQMHEDMGAEFTYETLRNFNNRASSARGYIIDEIDQFLTEEGY